MSKKPSQTGLDAALANLDLSSSLHDLPLTAPADAPTPYRTLAVADVYPDPDQPRRTIDQEKLVELAQTIAAHGLIQPIKVRPHPTLAGKWMIVAGERRWRATKLNNEATINAIVDEDENAERRAAVQIIENVQREDVAPMELVDGYTKLATDFGLSATKIAQMVGRSKQVIGEYLAVGEMTAEYRSALTEGRVAGISPLVELWRAHVQHPELAQRLLADSDPERPLSRSMVRAAINQAKQPPVPGTGGEAGEAGTVRTDGAGSPPNPGEASGGGTAAPGTGHTTPGSEEPATPADSTDSGKQSPPAGGTSDPSGNLKSLNPAKATAGQVQIVVAEVGKDDEAGILDLSPCKVPGHVFVVDAQGQRTAYQVDMLRMVRLA